MPHPTRTGSIGYDNTALMTLLLTSAMIQGRDPRRASHPPSFLMDRRLHALYYGGELTGINIPDEYQLIQRKKSKLSRGTRDRVVEAYELRIAWAEAREKESKHCFPTIQNPVS